MNRKSTTNFPTSYRWSAYVTLESPKEARKAIFVFLNKTQFQTIKVCYKVSLCENFQQDKLSCSTVYRYWRET